MRSKIVITGMGAVTPIGIGVEKYWNSLINGICGIDKITKFDTADLPVKIAAEIKNFSPTNWMTPQLAKQTDAFSQFAYISAKEALGDKLPVDADRMGIVMGTAMAGTVTVAVAQEALMKAVHKNVGPRFVPRILGNMAAAQIAIAYGIHGPNMTISTACASGGDSIAEAANMLLLDEADAVLAVGGESILCPVVMYSLASAHALSRQNDDPKTACCPFDKKRNGFVIGEGGGALVLETEEHAKKRGAVIYAELAGWANNTDGYHITSPVPDGSIAAKCMNIAMKKANVKANDIGYINAHGTSTMAGDAAEIAAVEKAFGDNVPLIGSTKGATGHMMAAGGITEAICCIQAIRTGIIPPTLNLTDPDFDHIDIVGSKAINKKIDVAMTNALGFGGQNSSLIFKKY